MLVSGGVMPVSSVGPRVLQNRGLRAGVRLFRFGTAARISPNTHVKLKPRFRSTILLVGAEDEENLALRSLAGYLVQEGIKPVVVAYAGPEDVRSVLHAVQKHSPAIFALSLAFQCLANDAFALLREIRRKGYRGHVVVGGHFATFDYMKILETQPEIDSVGRFEGELLLVRLARALEAGNGLSGIPNLVHRTNSGIAENRATQELLDLDQLPWPLRRRRAQIRLGERFATLVSSRGCWHAACTYCCIGAFHRERSSHSFTLRGADHVARELAWLYRRRGVRVFQFHDDNFVVRRTSETLTRIASLRHALGATAIPLSGIALLIKARPDGIDEAVATGLKDLGCVGVFLGVENASQTGLKSLIRGAQARDADRAIAGLSRQGIGVTYNLLIFHPHATMDEVSKNLAFVRAHIDIPFDFGRAEIVAGSPLERALVNERKLRGEWPHWDYEIEETAVQAMFELNRRTFRRVDSPYSPMMHALIALSYHAHALKRLHPGPTSDALLAEATGAITRANEFVLDCLERLRDLALLPHGSGAVDDLNRHLSAACIRFRGEVWSLVQKMERLQFAERVFQRFGVREAVQTSFWISKLLGCQIDTKSMASRHSKTVFMGSIADEYQ